MQVMDENEEKPAKKVEKGEGELSPESPFKPAGDEALLAGRKLFESTLPPEPEKKTIAGGSLSMEELANNTRLERKADELQTFADLFRPGGQARIIESQGDFAKLSGRSSKSESEVVLDDPYGGTAASVVKESIKNSPLAYSSPSLMKERVNNIIETSGELAKRDYYAKSGQSSVEYANERPQSLNKINIFEALKSDDVKAGFCDNNEAKKYGWGVSSSEPARMKPMDGGSSYSVNKIVEQIDNNYTLAKQMDYGSKGSFANYGEKIDYYAKQDYGRVDAGKYDYKTIAAEMQQASKDIESGSRYTEIRDAISKQNFDHSFGPLKGEQMRFGDESASRLGRNEMVNGKLTQDFTRSDLAGGKFDSGFKNFIAGENGIKTEPGFNGKLPGQEKDFPLERLTGDPGQIERSRQAAQTLSANNPTSDFLARQAINLPAQQEISPAPTRAHAALSEYPEPEKKLSPAEQLRFALAPPAPQQGEKTLLQPNLKADLGGSSLARLALPGDETSPLNIAKAFSLASNLLSPASEKGIPEKIASAPAVSVASLVGGEKALAERGLITINGDKSAIASIAAVDSRITGLALNAERTAPGMQPAAQDRTILSSEPASLRAAGIRFDADLALGPARKDIAAAPILSDRVGIMPDLHTVNSGKVLADGQRVIQSNAESARAAEAAANSNKIVSDKAVEGQANLEAMRVNAVKAQAGEPGAQVRVAGSEGEVDKTLLDDGAFEDGVDEEGKPIKLRRIRLKNGELYLTGVELTVAAILAMGGAAKLREPDNENSDKDENSDANQPILTRRSHLVAQGETLQSIAEEYYKNPAVAWLIADINLPNVKETTIDGKRIIELKTRQDIELPDPREVKEFLTRLRRDFDVERLVTFVSESTVDLELLNNFLGTVTGAGESELAPKRKPAISTKANTYALPQLNIDIEPDDPASLPVAEGLVAAVKELSGRVKTLVKRPERKLRPV